MVTCHSHFSLCSFLPLKWVHLPRPKVVNRQDTNTIILVLLMPHSSIHIQKSVTCFRLYKNQNQEKYQKNGPMSRRSKQEIRASVRIAERHAESPMTWSKCLLSYVYSHWIVCIHQGIKVGKQFIRKFTKDGTWNFVPVTITQDPSTGWDLLQNPHVTM